MATKASNLTEHGMGKGDMIIHSKIGYGIAGWAFINSLTLPQSLFRLL